MANGRASIGYAASLPGSSWCGFVLSSRRRKGCAKARKLGLFLFVFWIKLLIINRFLALFLLKISPFRLIFPYCLVPALPNLSINSSLTSWYCQGEVDATTRRMRLNPGSARNLTCRTLLSGKVLSRMPASGNPTQRESV